VSDSLQPIRDRLREGRAHGSPAPAAAVLTMRHTVASNLVHRNVEEDSATATRAEHARSVQVAENVLGLAEGLGESVKCRSSNPLVDKHPSNGPRACLRSVARFFPPNPSCSSL